MADDFEKTGFGLSGLEAASAGTFNPDYGYTPYVQNQYNPVNMNTVSIQYALPSTEGRGLTSLCCRTSTLLGSRRRPRAVCQIPQPPCFQLVLTLPKALTDSDTIASPTSDVPWDGNLFLPTLSAPEPQHVSGTHRVTAVFLTSLLSQGSFAHNFAAAAPPPRAPPPPADMAWHFQPGQSTHLVTPFTHGYGGTVGPYFNFPNTVGATS